MRILGVEEVGVVNSVIFFIGFLMVVASAAIASIGAIVDWDNIKVAGITTFILFTIGIGLTFGSFTFFKKGTEYQYKVIFEDGTTINEVFEQYDVVDREGEIYILRDREKGV